jgi:predicted nucleotide-binding protein (sugar kinase/HSP70/actin superfamily)
MRVGIPRALYYYHYYPLWRAFLDTLGVEVVVSPPTSQSILAGGVNRVTGEACLPSKIYCGHIMALADHVDYVLTPLIRRLTPVEANCSRFLGLPDLVRAAVPGAPPILAPEVDLKRGNFGWVSAIVDLGRRFTFDPLRVKRAVDDALAAQARYHDLLRRGLTAPEAIDRLDGGATHGSETACPGREMVGLSPALGAGVSVETRPAAPRGAGLPEQRMRVALLGHPYNLYDGYANHDLLRRLRALGLALTTSDQLIAGLPDSSRSRDHIRPYWTYEAELVEAGEACVGQVAGVIAVAAFACGPDAVLLETLEKLCRHHNRPFLKLILDEHTGEAGLVTRVEAFVDMLERRERLLQR